MRTLKTKQLLEHQKEIQITAAHLDHFHHVNNVQYVHWVEMIASEHWNLIKEKSKYAEHHWFLIEHQIRYKQQVFLGDVLTVKTYPEKPEGIRQPRKVEFYKNGQLVVDSRTIWILTHPTTQKITKLSADWLDELV